MNIHPSKDIVGTKGNELAGRKIVLCVTGSVAAAQCPEIARELMRHGAEVFTVMSEMAQKIIHPYLMEWATGNPVVTELTGKIEHVAMVSESSGKADLVLVTPATANTIGKIAHGIDDTPVTSVVSVALGSSIPIIVAPAMHESMYHHPILDENIKKLQAVEIGFLGPRIEEGKAKIVETEEIVRAVIQRLSRKDMAGFKVLVAAGPTLEHLDPVRVITNKSSGKMGIAIAEEAHRRGAQVTLVYGPGTEPPPQGIKVLDVEKTKEMHDSVLSELRSTYYDVFVSVAAASDYAPQETYDHKVSSHKTKELVLKLKSTPKMIDEVKKTSPDTFLVAFRAEYKLSDEELIESAYRRLKSCNADMIVANDVGREGAGFQADTNEVFIIDRSKKTLHIPLTSKKEVAKRLINLVLAKTRGEVT